MLEAYTTISYLSAITQKMKLGVLVSCNFFRHPGLLIKMMSSMDTLSQGRVYFGLGAGWFEEEAHGLGIPYPTTWTERFERLEETLQIAYHLWAGTSAPFHGKHFQLANPINRPAPVSQPHPPIIIGGGGEKKTLRLVAKYADATNLVVGSPCALDSFGVLSRQDASYADWLQRVSSVLQRKLDILQEHCKTVRRDYAEIQKSVVTYIKVGADGMSSDEILQLCQDFALLGFEYIIFVISNLHEIEPLRVIGEQVISQIGKKNENHKS